MPRIVAQGDNLNELNKNYVQVALKEPVFLNSVPKSGTHLLRNIMRMFVPFDQQYHQAFIQIPILRQHTAAFAKDRPWISWGHLLFSDDSAIALRGVRHLLLVRDPYDWVLARARFFLSDTFEGSLEHLKGGKVSAEEIMNMMILGIHNKAPTMQEIYVHNAMGWLGTDTHVLKFEDLLAAVKGLDSENAEKYFSDLLDKCGLGELPDDWRDRVLTGSDRKQSGTARENLAGPDNEIPEELPEMQKRLVDAAAPGLRALLGYQ